jgi:hypothetical protein
MAVSLWDAMNFILYSDVNDSSISQSLGRPEYSYYFVLKAYRPVLESLGRVHVVSTTTEVDPLYRQLLSAGEESLFLSFSPPQKTPTDLECPAICIVAWEFDSIPDEQWDDEPRTLGLSADALVPIPLTAEEEAALAAEIEAARPPPLTLKRRFVIARHYSRLWALNLGREQTPPVPRVQFLQHWYWEGIRDLVSDKAQAWLEQRLPAIAGTPAVPVIEPQSPELPDTSTVVETTVDGVIYVSVFNPQDGRKNWHQLITAFCWAFRDTPDATLVLKITQGDLASYYSDLMTLLAQLSPCACRVLVMHGYLDDAQFARLYEAASFYVNASRCEGLCLPLMEFMASGKPVIAPNHTAMEDYIDESVAFVVRSSEELTIWPQDTRIIYRTLRHRPDWGSLKIAYEDSYRMAKAQPDRYRQMSDAAIQRMHDYCAFAPVQQRMADFLGISAQMNSAGSVRDNASC